MFDFVEQKNGMEKPKEIPKRPPTPEHDYVEQEVEFEDKEDYKEFLKEDYDRSGFEVAKQTIIILEDMATNATSFDDLKSDVS